MKHQTHLIFLSEIAPQDVKTHIMKLKQSFSLDDFGFSTQIVKQIAPNIAPLLAHIFNLSLLNGVFPDLLKNAHVLALYKGGVSMDPLNYRGISLLSVFSKILEKIAHKQLQNYLCNNKILHPLQYGFIKGKISRTSHISAFN